MSQEIKTLMERIKQIENSHPNVYYLWKSYLTKKHKEYTQLSIQCEEMLKLCDSIDDPQVSHLLTLTVLNIT